MLAGVVQKGIADVVDELLDLEGAILDEEDRAQVLARAVRVVAGAHARGAKLGREELRGILLYPVKVALIDRRKGTLVRAGGAA